MIFARTRKRILVSIVALSVALVVGWTLSGSSVAAAGTDGVLTEPPVVDRAGDEESDDPFHVSDSQLAVAILLPGFFLLVTGATVAWAVSRRARDEEDPDDA